MLFANREFRNGKNCARSLKCVPTPQAEGCTQDRGHVCSQYGSTKAEQIVCLVLFFFFRYGLSFFSLKVIFVLSFNFNSDVRVCLTFGAHKACCLQNLF